MLRRLNCMRVIVSLDVSRRVYEAPLLNVPLNLGIKFLGFTCVERCLILDLDFRDDLILGMAWLESHEP